MSKSAFHHPVYRLALALAAIVALSTIPVRSALVTTPGVTVFQGGGAVFDPDMAYDPISQRYLAVFTYLDQGPWGLFLDNNGHPDGGPFLIVNGSGLYPRVAARTGGNGGFLVTYFISGLKHAVFVRPGTPTILAGPLVVDSGVLFERDGGGLVYVPAFDKFLVTYPKGRHSWVAAVAGFSGNSADLWASSPVGVTELTGQCDPGFQDGEFLNRPEIAWDPSTQRALVTGYRDFSACSGGGAIWSRLLSFDGTTIGHASSFTLLMSGGVQWDTKVIWSAAAQQFVVAWVTSPSFGVLQVVKTTIAPNGTRSAIRTILPANFTNSSGADNAFGGQNQLGLAYNPVTGRGLLTVRGNDNSVSPDAPLFGLELTATGDAIPFSMRELLPTDAPRPFPIPVARPGTNSFLVLAKAGIPSNARGELDLMTTIVTGDGGNGSGSWPLNSGTDIGGGSPAPPPPPPPGGPSAFTLTIARPSGGTILGPEIFCGDGGAACSLTRPAGTVIELIALPGTAPLSSWGGCAPSFTLNSNMSCSPVFGAAAPPPPPPSPSGPFTLTIVRPSGGTILGPEIFCGDGGAACAITRAAGTVIELIALPGSSPLSTWGGCAPVMTLNSNVTCTPGFGSSSPPPAPPPPPPPGGGNGPFVLTVTSVAGGSVLGPGIVCGDMADACSVVLPKGIVVEFIVIPTGGNVFTGWLSCSNAFALESNVTCTPSYNGAGSPPAPPPPAPGGPITLTVVNPGINGIGGGFVLGPEMVCMPGNSCTLTLSSPTTVTLFAVPFDGFYFGRWVEISCAETMLVNSSRTCTADFNRF